MRIEQSVSSGYPLVQLAVAGNRPALRSIRGGDRSVEFASRSHDSFIGTPERRGVSAPARGVVVPDEKARLISGPVARTDGIAVPASGNERVMRLLNILDRDRRSQAGPERVGANRPGECRPHA
ncbi:hypothetical protein HKW98_17535 [Stutzerimonas urumqiensis]|uniref:hypothetical protein n=1 Tax=Stutzerimonas urumqiensis TaxID=638269 RepID=UPI003BA8E3D5